MLHEPEQQEGQLGQQARAAALAVAVLALPLLQRDQERVEHHLPSAQAQGLEEDREDAQQEHIQGHQHLQEDREDAHEEHAYELVDPPEAQVQHR